MGIASREHTGRTLRRPRRNLSFSPAATLLACLFLTACPKPDPTDRRATPTARLAESDSPSCLESTTLSERLEFATAERGSKILGRVDRWARQLSPFDRAARQRTLEPTTLEELLAFVSGNTLSWTPDERAYWSRLVDRLSTATTD